MDNNNNSEQELMERLDKCTALLKDYKRDNLIQAKEIDRLNEYIQVLELETHPMAFEGRKLIYLLFRKDFL